MSVGAPRPDAARPLDLLAEQPTAPEVRDLLREVVDPELGIDIVELGLLREVTIDGARARIRFTVTTPACPLSSYIEDQIRACLWQLPALTELDIECEYEPPWDPQDMGEAARAALGWSG